MQHHLVEPVRPATLRHTCASQSRAGQVVGVGQSRFEIRVAASPVRVARARMAFGVDRILEFELVFKRHLLRSVLLLPIGGGNAKPVWEVVRMPLQPSAGHVDVEQIRVLRLQVDKGGPADLLPVCCRNGSAPRAFPAPFPGVAVQPEQASSEDGGLGPLAPRRCRRRC